MNGKTLTGVSLFTGAGIDEQYLPDVGIRIVAANELIEDRARLYRHLYPQSKMICGDIMDEKVYSSLVESTPDKIDFLLASPPCQGMSIAGKNRSPEQMLKDKRNFLIFKIIDFMRLKRPDYVMIENVPQFLKIELPFEGRQSKITEILDMAFGKEYEIIAKIYDAADYGVAQHRNRAIVRLYRKGLSWKEPEKCDKITVREAIGHLPSIEAGEHSPIKWHFARKHPQSQIECMRHTPTGKSAMENEQYFPKKKNGEKVKAYNTTYRRIEWDEPAPTITIRNDAISSQMNVHPGNRKEDGTFSDARVLTPLELMLLSSLPKDWNIPDDTPELLIRKCIGESIPPLLVKKIVEQINR